jgi:hypothetical protein
MADNRHDMLANRPASASNSQMNRAALTNNPLRVRADGRTPRGRRIRDLFRAYQSAAGNPSDPAGVASILAAAELTVAAEEARAALLARIGDVDQVIRLENLAARAVRRLGIRPGAERKVPTLAEWAEGARDAPPSPCEGSGRDETGEAIPPHEPRECIGWRPPGGVEHR